MADDTKAKVAAGVGAAGIKLLSLLLCLEVRQQR